MEGDSESTLSWPCILGAIGLVCGILLLTHQRERDDDAETEWLPPPQTPPASQAPRLIRVKKLT